MSKITDFGDIHSNLPALEAALVDMEQRKLEVRFIRVPYDVERAAGAIESSEMPDEYAQMLRSGRG